MVSTDPKLDVHRARRLIVMPEVEARKLVEQAAVDLAERRARRRARGVSGRTHRCQGCNAFMASYIGVCSACGYRQDVGWAA